jgi:ABC-type dipeptide/oligopeptide/nickel transport system permease subunit
MSTNIKQSNSLFKNAIIRILSDKLSLTALILVAIYFFVAFLVAIGVLASDWGKEVASSYAEPSSLVWFGADIFGRSVMMKVIKATETAVMLGVVVSMISMLIGASLGMVAGYFGGIIDEVIVWFYTTVSSIPGIMLLVAIAFILGKGTMSVFLSLGLTSWVGLCRIVRAEVMKHKDREYVQAANAIGASTFQKLVKHILPNISHLLIINFTQTFDSAIKAEVILSFLGLSVVGRPSWGGMIDDAKLELGRGVWWQLAAATLAMFIIVLAFNVLGDALRDALDPKLKGK